MRIHSLVPLIVGIAMTWATLLDAQVRPSSTFSGFTIPAANGKGSTPTGINKWGSVVGYYPTTAGYDSFVWNGAVTTVRVPGQVRTYAQSINSAGWIVGYYGTNQIHGFLRNPKYTTLDVPGSGNQTYATSINDAGQVAGVYFDASGVEHGFILDGLGNYTTIDVAGGILVTNAILSQNGEVAGTYEDANYIPHGYVRDTLGNVTSFDVVSGGGTYVWGINASGEIAGVAGDVFVRDASGNITTFGVAGLNAGDVIGIADNENVYGRSRTRSGAAAQGWKHTAAGAFNYFEDPNAGSKGSQPTCVSGNAKVAGFYWDEQNNLIDFEMH